MIPPRELTASGSFPLSPLNLSANPRPRQTHLKVTGFLRLDFRIVETFWGETSMTGVTERKLFSPVQIGPITLQHRVVMAPLTRSRSVQPGDIPGDLMVEYYGQRASDGGLIISEATTISISGRGWYGAPGM